MEDNLNIEILRPQEPRPKGDLDDLIFQGDSWLASDR